MRRRRHPGGSQRHPRGDPQSDRQIPMHGTCEPPTSQGIPEEIQTGCWQHGIRQPRIRAAPSKAAEAEPHTLQLNFECRLASISTLDNFFGQLPYLSKWYRHVSPRLSVYSWGIYTIHTAIMYCVIYTKKKLPFVSLNLF